MKTIRFYADENLPRAIIEELRQLDYDVLTSYEAQQANKSISDENVLKFAQERNKIIITLNRDDFVSLHQQGEAHSGIIICKDDQDYKGQVQLIDEFILQDDRSLQGRLIRIKKQNQKGTSVKVFTIQEY
ncbi:DUF5615 family PIN-like protein [Chlorogloea sp. CCALA 695]|uniref:DUF5615 family PIN-like protein n=1 Tax=Chlorogloea sp. CCALA 695 TaxID=2107693 RepID=UPI0018EC0410|nr:DUF5615 family PIN-like protein [Chlorogloea sp. CCALA 695]